MPVAAGSSAATAPNARPAGEASGSVTLDFSAAAQQWVRFAVPAREMTNFSVNGTLPGASSVAYTINYYTSVHPGETGSTFEPYTGQTYSGHGGDPLALALTANNSGEYANLNGTDESIWIFLEFVATGGSPTGSYTWSTSDAGPAGAPDRGNDLFANCELLPYAAGDLFGRNYDPDMGPFGKEAGEGGTALSTVWFEYTPRDTTTPVTMTIASWAYMPYSQYMGIWRTNNAAPAISNLALVSQGSGSLTFTPAAGYRYFVQVGGSGTSYTGDYLLTYPAGPPVTVTGHGTAAGRATVTVGHTVIAGVVVVSPGGADATGHSSAELLVTVPPALQAAGTSSATADDDVHGSVGFLDEVTGGSFARFANAVLAMVLDDAAGTSDADVDCTRRIIPGLDAVTGRAFAAVTFTPDLSGNPPIKLSVELSGHYLLTPDETADETVAELAADDWETEVNADTASDDTGLVHAAMMAPTTPAPPVNYRTVPVVVIDMPAPIVTRGRPTMPANVGLLPSSFSARQGAQHIHAEDPQTQHPRRPRPADETPPWAARWTVDDLPSPGDGYYWLGAPSAADGTAGISKAHQSWGEQDGKAPAWHSFFPYKPSVRAIDHYLPDGGIVHHPKGLHFNSQYVEHMWLEFAGPKPQPFTWAIAGMIAGYPERDYLHYILDAGRNPDRVGFPRLSADAVYADHTINDGLDYRSLIAYGHHGQYLTARNNMWTNRTVRARTVANYAPRMFFGVFDGSKSRVGAFQSRGLHVKSGAIDHGAPHRYYVLGRSQGVIGQRHASHLLIFEIRFWRKALSQDQLEANFDQVSSTWQFHKYRRG